MEVSEENVQMILSMGFPSESEVRRALRRAKNDLSDAVAILTDDNPMSSYDTVDDIDIDMKDTSKAKLDPVYGPSLPPSYDEAIDGSEVSLSNCVCSTSSSIQIKRTAILGMIHMLFF